MPSYCNLLSRLLCCVYGHKEDLQQSTSAISDAVVVGSNPTCPTTGQSGQ